MRFQRRWLIIRSITSILLISAILVLLMQAGFAALESGLGPQNNTANIMFKNYTDLCVGAFLFRLVGYSIMYGSDVSGGLGIITNNSGHVFQTNPPLFVAR